MNPIKNSSLLEHSFHLGVVDKDTAGNNGTMPTESKNENIVYRNLVMAAVEATLEYITRNPLDNKTADDFALEANLSRSRLQKYFKERTGKGIVQYRNEFRLEMSLPLLQEGRMEIKQVAKQCGYTPTYYCRAFKLKYKMTSTQWQQKHSVGGKGKQQV